MAHMMEKWLEEGKGTEKWRRILVIGEGKMSLSRDAESRWTSVIDRMKWEGKSIVRCLRRDSKNQAQGSVMELLKVNEKERYWTINLVHVGVEFLDKHERTCDWDVTQWLPSPTVNDKGKVSVGKVRQNDLAFRMNASSREVLRECLKGIIIIEPDSRRRRISRWRGIGTKRIPSKSGFTFGCHRHN